MEFKLVSYDNSLVEGIGEGVGWFSILIASIFIRDYYLQCTKFVSLSDKESMIKIPVIPVYILKKKKQIKIVSVLKKPLAP